MTHNTNGCNKEYNKFQERPLQARAAIVDRPRRDVIWTGGVGGGCLREAAKLPAFELVGVLGFSKSKQGRDAGELVGSKPIGVRVTGDNDKLYAADAACVLHTPMSTAAEQTDKDVVRLLKAASR